MKNRLLFSSLFLFVIGTVVVNFSSFKNLQAEYIFRSMLEAQDPKLTYDYTQELFPSFPNISAVATPIDIFKASMALREGNVQKGFDHLDKAKKINTYTHVADLVLAEFFLANNLLEDARKYGAMAFKGWPKNDKHFSVYNDILVKQRDTLSILNTYDSLPQNLKDKPVYFKKFNESFSKAKLMYLVTDYPDAKFLNKNQLLGTWTRGYNFPNQFIKDTTLTYEFTNDQMITKDGSIYHYDLKNDSIYISFYESRKLLNKYPIKYSDSLETLIFGNVKILNGNLQDQFFKKLDE